jgi:hypothetical protein
MGHLEAWGPPPIVDSKILKILEQFGYFCNEYGQVKRQKIGPGVRPRTVDMYMIEKDGSVNIQTVPTHLSNLMTWLKKGWRIGKPPGAKPPSKVSLRLRIHELLKSQGKKEAADIATQLNASPNSVKTVLNRNKSVFVHYPDGWGLVLNP